MLTSDISNADVTLAVHRDEGTGRALIGADVGGVFVPFYETKLSLFDDFLRAGKQQQDAQRANEQQQPDQQQPQQ